MTNLGVQFCYMKKKWHGALLSVYETIVQDLLPQSGKMMGVLTKNTDKGSAI